MQASTTRCPTLSAGPITLCLAGLLAGALTWGLLAMVYPQFHLPEDLRNLPNPAPADLLDKLVIVKTGVDLKNSMLAVGLLGLMVGSGLGLAEALRRLAAGERLCLPVAWSGLGGAVGGVLAGAAGHFTLQGLAAQTGLDPMTKMILAQAVLWCLLGAGVGGGLGSWTPSWSAKFQLMAGGMLAGIVAAILYPALSGWLFPMDPAVSLVPASAGSRAFWLLLGPGLIGPVCATMGQRPARA